AVRRQRLSACRPCVRNFGPYTRGKIRKKPPAFPKRPCSVKDLERDADQTQSARFVRPAVGLWVIKKSGSRRAHSHKPFGSADRYEVSVMIGRAEYSPY